MYNESKPHRSSHIVDDVVVDTTVAKTYVETGNPLPQNAFKFADPIDHNNEKGNHANGSVIVHQSGDTNSPIPMWGMTI